jgi:hypothetical protein
MIWRRKRRKKETYITEIPMSTLARWYFYDAGLDDPKKMAALVGMMPDSVEGSEMEEEASDQRMERIVPLMPFLETISEINARSIATLQFDHFIKENNVDLEQIEHEKDHIEDMYRQVGYSALLAAFSGALELGIIDTDTIKGDIRS